MSIVSVVVIGLGWIVVSAFFYRTMVAFQHAPPCAPIGPYHGCIRTQAAEVLDVQNFEDSEGLFLEFDDGASAKAEVAGLPNAQVGDSVTIKQWNGTVIVVRDGAVTADALSGPTGSFEAAAVIGGLVFAANAIRVYWSYRRTRK